MGGVAFFSLFEQGENTINNLAKVMIFVILVGALLMLNSKNLLQGWGLVKPGENTVSGSIFEQCCKNISLENKLTGRESEVFLLLAKGHNRAHICEQLCLSKDTIKTHAKNVYRKLHIHSQQEVIGMVEDSVREAENENSYEPKSAF